MPYESRRNTQNNNSNMNTNTQNTNTTSNGSSLPSSKDKERQNREKASAKAVKRAAETAGAYFGGPLGKKAVNLASKTKAGQNLLNKGGQVLNNIPGMGKTTKKLDNAGVLGKDEPVKNKNKNINVSNKVENDNRKIDNVNGGGPERSSLSSKLKPSFNDNSDNDNTSTNNTDFSNNNKNVPTNNITRKNNNDNDNDNDNDRPNIAGLGPFARKKNNSLLDNNDNDNNSDNEDGKTKDGKALGRITMSIALKITILLAPLLILVIIIVALISSVFSGVGGFVDAFGALFTAGEEIGDMDFEIADEKANAFYNRINDIKLEYQATGRNVDVLKIAAVYTVFFSDIVKYSYDDMTNEVIKEVADCMFLGNSYDEDTFKDNLLNYLIPKYAPKTTDNERDSIVEDIFEYMENYYSMIGKNSDTVCASIGSCIYDIKGFYIPNRGNVSKSMNVSNLMVRLMECGGAYGTGNDNTPIDQPLVPFEDYVMGVAYAEIGTSYPDEAIKAQMVAARSYALSRPISVGNANGKKLAEENGQWVLQIASCVSDQVFCNVDEGCSYMGGGDGQGGIVRSGIIPGAVRTNPALAENHRLRVLAAEVQGEYLVNNQGNVFYTSFGHNIQEQMNSLATNSHLNYKQILMQIYGSSGATDIKSASCNNGDASCSGSASSGPFASWKQYKGPWVDVVLGNSSETIRSAGCLVTSVAMLIAKSGVDTTIDEFNPGSFVEHLNTHNGFSGANFMWNSVTSAAPNFSYQGKVNVADLSRKEKLNRLKGLLDRGFYVVAEVKGSTGQHWVAIDGLSGDSILMMDPGSESTDMWGQYSWKNTSQFAYFMVN